MTETITFTDIPSIHANYAYLEALASDGWTFSTGPWGSSVTDRSIVADKEYPEFGGYFHVQFIDRDFKGIKETTLDIHQNGWFILPSMDGYAKQERAFITPDVNAPYSLDLFVEAIGFCDYDKEFVGYENLTPVAFANAVCKDHLEVAQTKWEAPGWAN
jgi:hypothetical protein